MDFNLRSKFWPGNIYHQFESICQDVDGFVNKDTLKFVGNQMQNVGISVKRLYHNYSNVVQDILPFPGDIAKPERQLAASGQGGMQDQVSVTGCTAEKQLPKYQGSNEMEISKSTLELQTCQYLSGNDNATVQNSEDISIAEKMVTRDLKSVTANSSLDSGAFYRMSDEDYLSSSVFSAHEVDSTSIVKERQNFDHQKVDKDLSDGTTCLSETSSNIWSSKSISSVFEDPSSDENGSLLSPPAPVSTHKVNEDNYPPYSPFPLACEAVDYASEKDRVLCESCNTKHENVV